MVDTDMLIRTYPKLQTFVPIIFNSKVFAKIIIDPGNNI